MVQLVTLDGIDAVRAAVGQTFGPSAAIQIDQECINLFAQATGDHQWIHVDPVRAAEQSPFGRTIAHGYLTLSLAPALLGELVEFTGFAMAINYGCNKVRFLNPVVVDSLISMSATVAAVDDVTGGIATTLSLTFHLDGVEKPACVADVIFRQYV
jgi:acyl dehydratase